MKRFILISTVTVLAVAFFIYQIMANNLREPSIAEMRAFRLSTLTDENLRELHAKARAEVERLQADYARTVEVAESRVYAEIAVCESKIDDVAYRARHYPTGCPRPSSLKADKYSPPIRIMSVNEAYENMIMDGCERKDTVLEARYSGCLP